MTIKLTPEMLVNEMQAMQIDEKLGSLIQKLNFECAENMPWCDYKQLDTHIKKAEFLFKTYALACAKEDKKLRMETMRVFRELLELLPRSLIRYRKHVKACREDMKEE